MVAPTRRITRLLIGALVAAGLLAPAAPAQDPPPAQPDLGAMAIGLQDLPPGAKVTAEGSATVPGAAVGYERMFTLSGRAARAAGFVFLDSSVQLCEDVPPASSLFRTMRRGFASTRGRRILARAVAAGLDVPVRRVKIGRVRDAHVGDESFRLLVIARGAGMVFREGIAIARVDRAVDEIVTGGFGSAARLKRRTLAMLDVTAQRTRAAVNP
jgi:hypothetical protein